jgi:hypothetical protein
LVGSWSRAEHCDIAACQVTVYMLCHNTSAIVQLLALLCTQFISNLTTQQKTKIINYADRKVPNRYVIMVIR